MRPPATGRENCAGCRGRRGTCVRRGSRDRRAGARSRPGCRRCRPRAIADRCWPARRPAAPAVRRPADLPEAEALPLLLEQLAAAQQRLVLVAAFALEVEDLQHPLHRTGLAALAEKAHAGAQEDIQRRHPGVFVGYLDLAEGAVAHRQADLDLVLVVAVDRTARNPGGVRQVGHGSGAHALFQENPLGGIEYAVAGFLGFLFGFPGH